MTHAGLLRGNRGHARRRYRSSLAMYSIRRVSHDKKQLHLADALKVRRFSFLNSFIVSWATKKTGIGTH